MDEKMSVEKRTQYENEAVRIGKEKGFEAALAYLIEAGYDKATTPQYLGFLLGTWQPVEYDEDGNVKTIWN